MDESKVQAFKDYVQQHKLSPIVRATVKAIDILFFWGVSNWLFPGLTNQWNGREDSNRQFGVYIGMFMTSTGFFIYRAYKTFQTGKQLGLTLDQISEILKTISRQRPPSWIIQNLRKYLDFFSVCMLVAGVCWTSWKYFYGIQTVDPFNPFYVVIILELFLHFVLPS